jgi:hypothetical protein
MPKNIDRARQEAGKIALEAVPDPSDVPGASPQAMSELGCLRVWLAERSELACPNVGEIPIRGSTAKEWLDRESQLDLDRKLIARQQETEEGYASREVRELSRDLGVGMDCPHCGEWFRLEWRDDEKHFPTLFVVEKGEGPMTAVRIECPYCDYEEDL